MDIRLHKNAATTPRIRREIQLSSETSAELARRYGIHVNTVRKWRKRDTVEDGDHTPKNLATTLTPEQEAIVVEARKTLLAPLDDLLKLTKEFLNPKATRSSLHRCLKRHGVGSLNKLKGKAQRPAHSPLKAYETGYLQVDVKYLPKMPGQIGERYLFVAIDRATRWVFLRIYTEKTAENAASFLSELYEKCPSKVRTILTDSGKEFTDGLFGKRVGGDAGIHRFDRKCAEMEIEHLLTPPRSPQTDGMGERFNGRIEDVLQSQHFHSGEDLAATLHRYAFVYNERIPQVALKGATPMQAMVEWFDKKPELFRVPLQNHTGRDS